MPENGFLVNVVCPPVLQILLPPAPKIVSPQNPDGGRGRQLCDQEHFAPKFEPDARMHYEFAQLVS